MTETSVVMHTDWIFVLIFCCSLLGSLVSSVVLFTNRGMPFPARILSLMLFCISISLFHNGLLTSGWILKVPFLFQYAVFPSLCIAPLLFIYVRAVLTQQWRFPASDVVFLIIAATYTLKFLPIYLLQGAGKLDLVTRALNEKETITHEEGSWLPGSWGIALRFLYGFMLTLISGGRVFAWYRRSVDKQLHNAHNISVFKWLTFLVSVLSLGYLIMMFEFFLHVNWKPNLVLWMTLTICVAILAISIYLLFKPEILYGFRHYVLEDSKGNKECNEAGEERKETVSSKSSLTRKQSELMKQVIENHLKINKPFLKPGYAVGNLSAETGFPSYLVSLFINQEYGKNFNELVNQYRLTYITDLLEEGSVDLDQYTLEGLGKIGGFNSRAAFISAVKKQYGKTPAQMFRRRSINQDQV